MGTFCANIMPPLAEKKQCCWIWNTDEASKQGQHLVAFFKKDKTVHYFGSYGKPIEFYKRSYWQSRLAEIGLRLVTQTTVQRQSMISTTCGTWALLYLYQMCYNVLSKKKKSFLATTIVRNKDKLVDNEFELLQITFKVFSNFRAIY